MSSFTGKGSYLRAAAAAGVLAAVFAGCGEEPDGVESVTSAIVGGTVATPHQFPWMAGLLQTGAVLPECGGSLVSPSWVVTAAHCVAGSSPSGLSVVLGDQDMSVTEGTEQRRGVKQIYSFLWGLGKYNNDIALLELASPVTLTSAVQPIKFDRPPPPVGATTTASGWGAQVWQGPATSVLRKVNLPVLDPALCGYVGTSLLCTGSATGGPGICNGDSGGPLLWVDRGTNILAGVTSSHQQCKGYSGFTAVSQFVPWIRNAVFAPLTATARLPAGGLGETHLDEGTGNWSTWRSLGDTTATTQPAMTLDDAGVRYAFACAGGAVQSRTSADGVTWTAWSSLGGNCADAPAVTFSRDSNPAITIFTRGSDNLVRWATWVPPGAGAAVWTPLAGAILGNPAVTTTRFGRMLLAARRSDAGIWVQSRAADQPSGWSGWVPLGGASFTSGPAVFETAEGRQHVLATNGAGVMLHRWFDPATGAWTATWQPVMGQLNPTAAPAVTDSLGGSHMDAFALGANGAMRHWYLDLVSGNWFVKPDIAGAVISGPGAL